MGDGAAQTARSGVSLNHYISPLLAAQAGSQAEVDRTFAARAARAVLAEAGRRRDPRAGDRLDAE